MMFGAPCGALEEETEQVAAVEAGGNTLVGRDPERFARAALEAQRDKKCAWPYGDGWTGERVASILARDVLQGD